MMDYQLTPGDYQQLPSIITNVKVCRLRHLPGIDQLYRIWSDNQDQEALNDNCVSTSVDMY